jgi:CBS domain-containing protein/sporulation protein YlmC with PRC-barrel domain
VSAPTRVFIARLAGLAVFDPRGDQVGKVRDVVVVLRHGHHPPRVLGLVVEVQPRRRVFCPMTRVTAIDAGAVVTTGVLNMRRFEQRPGETLVLAELLDTTVDLLDTGEQVAVQDVGMELGRARDWTVTRIYVKKGGHGFRRRGETFQVDWDDVSGLSIIDPEQGTESLLATVEGMRPADLANVLHELSAKRRVELAAVLDDIRLADVLEELPEDDRVEIIAGLGQERAADVLEEMSPDDAADLLSELPPDLAELLLGLVEPDDAEDLRRLLTYDDSTAGGMMTTEPVILPPDATVADALARVRDHDLSPALAAQVYVVRPPFETPTGKYLGVAHFQRLLREPPSTLVSAVLDSDLEAIEVDAPLAQVTRYFAMYDLLAIPVVDEANHLLGAVTVDDVVDHMLPDNWRDEDLDGHADPAPGVAVPAEHSDGDRG